MNGSIFTKGLKEILGGQKKVQKSVLTEYIKGDSVHEF